jgi:predicted nicotinamide N-methyase
VKTLRKRLRSHLRGLTELTETRVEIGDRTYHVTHPVAADALIDEEEFAQDERLPYWADLWPSSVALARDVFEGEHLGGRRAVELGCGVGLPSITALARGADILATDHYEAALDFARYNALVNLGRELRTQNLDWHAPRTQGPGYFDLVLVADVLYERRNVTALTALIPTLLIPGGEILLADPGRKNAPVFLEGMRDLGFDLSTEERLVSLDDRTVTTFVHRLRS